MFRRLAGCILLLALGSVQVLPAEEPYQWPVDDPTYVTSTFGEFRGDHLHNGIDFSTGHEPGRNVYAIDEGRVVRVFYDSSAYGKTLIVKHNDGRRSWYSHLRRFSDAIESRLTEAARTREGQSLSIPVERGETIARSGHTGSGPSHLHLTLEDSRGNFINPIGYFEPDLPFDPEPDVRSFRFYPLTGSAWVNGRSRSVSLTSPEQNPLKVWGRVGIDLEVVNNHRDNSSQSVPEEIRLYRDGNLMFSRSFERLSPFQQDTGTYTIYDEVHSNLNPTHFMLHATPSVDGTRWTGLNFTDSGSTGTIRIEVETVRNRRERYEFEYKTVPPPRSVHWNERKVTKSPDEAAKPASRNLKMVSLSNRQRAKTQYSPPDYGGARSAALTLDHRWLYNRLRFDVTVRNHGSGWPELTVEKNNFDTNPRLIQVEPGIFRAWWNPDFSRDGWHTVTVSLESDGGSVRKSERIYIQSIQPETPGSVISLDGRFSLFTTGEGVQVPTTVTFREVDRPPTNSELEYIGPPRRLDPKILNARHPFELTADLTDGVDDPRRVGLYRWNPLTGQWDVLSFRSGLTERSRVADVYSSQTVALLKDLKAPGIQEPTRSTSGDYVLFEINEVGSGIRKRDVEVRVGGQPVTFRWDSYYDAVYVPRKHLGQHGQRIELTVSDRAGNTSEWSGHFVP